MNMQFPRPLPQNGDTIFRPHEAREHHAASSIACQGKVEFYNRRAEQDHYDDGLVHGHFWAMSSTVR